MATNGVPVTFVGLFGNAFYFDDAPQDEIASDTFEYSKTHQNLIRCPDNRFLILNKYKQFDLKDLNSQQQSSSDNKIYIVTYRDLSPQTVSGRAVMLYALKDDKKYVAVCKNDKEISAEEVNVLQERIEDTKHKALFYMALAQQPNQYKLRSSLYPNKALGFDETDLNKLVLCPYDEESQWDRVTILK